MSNSTMQVTTAPGMYVVTETNRKNVRVYIVGKDKTCTCGGKAEQPCPHIEAVAAYRQAGGKQAPEAVQKASASLSSLIPTTCPICGSAVQVEDATSLYPLWRCQSDSSHYWMWRGERNGVREFLTQSHPNKMGAFYEQTPEQRDRFLASAQERLASFYADTAPPREWVGAFA